MSEYSILNISGRNSFGFRIPRRCFFRKILLLFPQSFSFLIHSYHDVSQILQLTGNIFHFSPASKVRIRYPNAHESSFLDCVPLVADYIFHSSASVRFHSPFSFLVNARRKAQCATSLSQAVPAAQQHSSQYAFAALLRIRSSASCSASSTAYWATSTLTA